jgi:hypothetical protein
VYLGIWICGALINVFDVQESDVSWDDGILRIKGIQLFFGVKPDRIEWKDAKGKRIKELTLVSV